MKDETDVYKWPEVMPPTWLVYLSDGSTHQIYDNTESPALNWLKDQIAKGISVTKIDGPFVDEPITKEQKINHLLEGVRSVSEWIEQEENNKLLTGEERKPGWIERLKAIREHQQNEIERVSSYPDTMTT